MQNKIFISCSSKDGKAALTICSAIEARGYNCWVANRDVRPGQNFQEEIVHAIGIAPLMVLVFSAHANNSSEIKKELALASQHNLTVIPVRLEDVAPSGAFVYELATRQWIDVFGDWEKAMQTLLQHITAALGDERQPKPVFSPTPAAKSRLPWIAGGLAATLLAAVGFWALRPTAPQQEPVKVPQAHAVIPTPKNVAMQPAPAPAPLPLPTADPQKLESDLWDSVKDSGDGSVLKTYLKKYPGGIYVAAAKAKIAALNSSNRPIATPVPVPAPMPAAASKLPQPATQSQPPAQAPVEPKLNPQIQQAVDMARAAERQAREKATEALLAQSRARQAQQQAQAAATKAEAGESGYGVLSGPLKVGDFRWAGGVSNSQPNGVGIFTVPAARLEGEAVNGVMTGVDVYFFTRGGGYQGELKQGSMDGFGVLEASGGSVFEGEFRNNVVNGLGVIIAGPAQLMREVAGQWSEGDVNYYAVQYWKDGRVSIGSFKKLKLDGPGAKYDAQGHLVEQGIYENDALKTPLKGN
jgi:hypothetical protein